MMAAESIQNGGQIYWDWADGKAGMIDIRDVADSALGASKESMMGMGFPEFIVDGYVELSRGFSQGFADTTNGNVEALSGHAPRSIDDFTKDFKSFFES